MTTIAVLDTETTGFEEPVLPVQVCLIELEGDDPRDFIVGEVWTRSFNPGRPIEYGAMSTHLISNEVAATYEPWDPALMPSVDMFIGHSIDYDWKAVGSPADVRRICTFAMGKRAWPDLDSHKQGAILISLLGAEVAIPLLQSAHQAEVDATNNMEIVRALAKGWDIQTWDEFYDLSETCRIPIEMGFGKWGPGGASMPPGSKKGLPIEEMVKKDWSYCTWLLKLDDLDPYLRKAIMNVKEGL